MEITKIYWWNNLRVQHSRALILQEYGLGEGINNNLLQNYEKTVKRPPIMWTQEGSLRRVAAFESLHHIGWKFAVFAYCDGRDLH